MQAGTRTVGGVRPFTSPTVATGLEADRLPDQRRSRRRRTDWTVRHALVFTSIPVRHRRGGNIPIELSTFIGRQTELLQLVRVQSATRLLTLVGPGGVGKSRLALRLAAARQKHAYPDGMWFVEFAQVTDPCAVAQSVVDVLGVRERTAESAMDALVRALHSRRLLLILDSCEHLIESCSELATRLLQTCPRLDILATSREPLDAAGDFIWRVPPLSLPPQTATDPGEVEASEAIQLFVDRARRQDPSFKLTSQNVREIVAVCRSLDGLPLALELVAARMGSMHEIDVAARVGLDLAGHPGPMRGPRRQYTLRATLDWSYDLLAEPERVLLRRLSVFVDGWTLAAAEAICSSEALLEPAVLETLGRLVARSLVMFDRRAGEGTYYLLETVNQYARQRLEEAGETDLYRARHLAYMLAFAEQKAPESFDPAHGKMLAREQANLRAALQWAIAKGDSERALRLAIAMFSLWFFRGQFAEGRVWFERALGLPAAADTPLGVRARVWLGQIALKQGDAVAADVWLGEALEQHERLGDTAGVALATLMLMHMALWQGDLERARGLCDGVAPLLRELRNPAETTALFQAAMVHLELGDLERAGALCEEGHRTLQRTGTISGYVQYLRGLVSAARGDIPRALSLLHEARTLGAAMEERQLVGDAQRELGQIFIDQGMMQKAKCCLAQAIEIACAAGDLIRLSRAAEGLARAVLPDDSIDAVRLAGAADFIRAGCGAVAWPSDRRRLDGWLSAARRRLTQGAFRTTWEAGRSLGCDEILALAHGHAEPETGPPKTRPQSLTPRERDVLSLLGRAFSNQQIAQDLNISVATARTHVERILSKLQLHSRAQAAVWASERGM